MASSNGKEAIKFTKSNLKNLEPKCKAYSVYDEEGYGLRVLVQPSGTKSYQIYRRIAGSGGSPTKVTLGKFCNSKGEILMLPEQAKKLAREKYALLADGINVNQKKKEHRLEEKRKKALTLGAFIENHFEPVASQEMKSAHQHIERVTRNFSHFFGIPMSDITKAAIATWRAEYLKQGHKPSAANREISALRGILSKAVAWGIIDNSPLRGLKALKTDKNPRPRFLSDFEEQQLRNALEARQERIRQERLRSNQWRTERQKNLLSEYTHIYTDYLKPLVLVAVNTGLRKSELLNLTWNDVDFHQNILTVIGTGKKDTTGTKSGHTRHVGLSNEARQVLHDWRTQTEGDGFVFPNPATGERLKDIKTAFGKVLKCRSSDLT